MNVLFIYIDSEPLVARATGRRGGGVLAGTTAKRNDTAPGFGL